MRVAGGAAVTQPARDEWTGTLRRGAEADTVEGFLLHTDGTRIAFTGWKDARPGRGYMLLGHRVEDDR